VSHELDPNPPTRRWPPGACRLAVPGRGRVVDPNRWLSAQERRTAGWLADRGHLVTAVARSTHRTPDVLVDGVPVEM
jgi:hypothetical protein